MADNPLLAALLGVNTSPQETVFGQGSNLVAQLVPSLYNPYASQGRNMASIAGAGLLAGLMGYAAKREAEAENRALMPQLANLLKAGTAEDIATLAADKDFSSKLAPVAKQLMLSQYTAQQEATAKKAAQLAELEGKASFELGPLGTALSEREQNAQLALIKARQAGDLEKMRQMQTLIGTRQQASGTTLSNLEYKTARDAARIGNSLQQLKDEVKDLSWPEIKKFIYFGISPTNKPGFAARFEQIQQQYRNPEFGATLTANEQKSSEAVFGKGLLMTKEDMIAGLNALSESQYEKAKMIVQSRLISPEEMLAKIEEAERTSTLSFKAGTPQIANDSKETILQQLLEQERELDAQLSAQGQ